jgi:hypothetical protein
MSPGRHRRDCRAGRTVAAFEGDREGCYAVTQALEAAGISGARPGADREGRYSLPNELPAGADWK